MNRWLVFGGLAVLILAWAGPLPRLVPHSFTAHMSLHMAVVGLGVPMVAIGLAPLLTVRANIASQAALPVMVSLLDLIVVWGWHAPDLHHVSRHQPLVLAGEQASFALVALLVWLVAFAAPPGRGQESALAGSLTLFFTAMHMTLLGALIGLAPRAIFAHGHAHAGFDALADQQLGGAIMVIIGGVVYLSGALVLMARVLLHRQPG
jgi:putative membrane protein